MTISEITEKLKELSDAEKEIKAKLDEMQSAFAEAVSKKQDEPPDDVWKIPIEMPQKEFGIYGMGEEDEGVSGYTVDYAGYMSKIKVIKSKWRTVEGHSYRRIFPTQEYAEMFREKTQLIADCLHFKWLYDREYVPIWDGYSDNWSVGYDRGEKRYTVCGYITPRHNTVFFSTKEVAEKCAEWLNYVYGEKKEK